MSSAVTAAVIGVGATVYASEQQRKAAKRAERAQKDSAFAAIEADRERYEQARQDYMPYSNMGRKAIKRVERLNAQGNPAAATINYQYRNQNFSRLPQSVVSSRNVGMNTPAANIDMQQRNYLVDTNQAHVDPLKYSRSQEMNDAIDFEMDKTDNVYRWKAEQARKAAAQSLAGSGLAGSKYGMSVQQDAAMGVAMDEYESQYGRALDRYGIRKAQQDDLYNRTAQQRASNWDRKFAQQSALYDREYGLKADNYNRGYQNAVAQYQAASDNENRRVAVAENNYNRAFQNAQYRDTRRSNQLANAFNMQNALHQQQYNQYLDAVKIGAGAAQSAGNWAMQSGQNAATIHMQAGQNAANSAIARSNAQTNLITGLAGAAGNAIGGYYSSR